MSPKFLHFLIRLVIFTLVLAAIGSVLRFILPPEYITPLFFPLLLLFFIVNLGVHYILLKMSKLSPRKFVSYFMLTTFGKLLLYLLLLMAYLITRPPGIVPFIVSFLALYILYTVFEVMSLLQQSKMQE